MNDLVVYAGRLRADAWSRDLRPAWLLVRDGRFAEIVPGVDRPGGWPGDRPHLDLGHAVVFPGLVDSHVHLTEPGDGTEPVDRPLADNVELGVANARTALRAGVTTVADCGGPPEAVLAVRAKAASLPDCARALVATAPITKVGGHSARYGGEVRDAADLRETVGRFAASGADFVKAMASGGGTPGAPPWEPGFDEAVLHAAVEAAASHGLPLKVHCLSGDSMRAAVTAGVALIEHGKFRNAAEDGRGFDPSVADLLARSGAVVCPTLSVGHHVLAVPPEESGEAGGMWGRRHPHDLDDFRRLVESGVGMVSGTDAGWRFTPFDALPGELRMMAGAGMTNRQALAAATADAATALGRGDLIGRIAPGYLADFVASGTDPVDDLTALDRLVAVARDGHVLR
ncbi:MAG: amidohydrolase family protein [Spirillospora sp.]